MSAIVRNLGAPVIQAPMGGGPSTPELAAAVGAAGGLGFLAAGYQTLDALAEDLAATRKLTSAFGVNVFLPGAPADRARVDPYLEVLRSEAERYDTAVGEARFSDDDWRQKVELLASEPVAVVSFTFGCPQRDVVLALQRAGSEVWVTVTGVEEARVAVDAGADVLIAQGHEAGAHQGSFDDASAPEPIGLLALLQLLGAEFDRPLVGSGGIASGAGLAAALAAGAEAAQIGTAFLLCPEAGTSEAHRRALRGTASTRFTRAFTGRRARGIVNRFLRDHEDAPSAYPELHYATAPIRAAARAAGDTEGINLWAGQAYPLAREEPARAIVSRLCTEASDALSQATKRL